jgi:hypothetical protein
MSGLAAKMFIPIVAVVAATGACSQGPLRNPVAPLVTGGDANSAAAQTSAASHGLPFTAVVGEGSGRLNVTASSRPGEFTLNAQVTANIHGVTPNTVFYLFRSGDIALPNGQQADGTCQRAAAGLFGPVPITVGGPQATLETSNGGAGALHFELQGSDPFLPDGSGVDVVYRLVNALPPSAATIDLRTPCFTFTAK